jgi:hypothetical protein
MAAVLISTIQNSEHLISLFQPAMSSSAVPWQRLSTMEILERHMLRFSCHSCPHKTLAFLAELNWTANVQLTTELVEVKVMLRPTVSRPVYLGIKHPIWGLRPDIYYCMTFAGFLMWGAPSDERTGLSFSRVTVSSKKPVVSMYNLHFTCY